MKGLRHILWVSCTAKETNEWVLNKAGVKRELLDTVKARKLAYCGHTMRKLRLLPGERDNVGTMPGARRRGRPRTVWMDNINTWSGLPMEESVTMTEDREMEKVHPWCGQHSDRGWQKKEQFLTPKILMKFQWSSSTELRFSIFDHYLTIPRNNARHYSSSGR